MERRHAGFLLAGGRSSRMGRDKALLPWPAGASSTLLEHVASSVLAAAGSVTVIGPPERYAKFGFPVAADRYLDRGPIGGIEKALSITSADWNLVVACDMPGLATPFLQNLLAAAHDSGADCVIPRGDGGRLEPLCAVYHRRCLAVVRDAIDRGELKVTAALAAVRVDTILGDPSCFANLNTPKDFDRLLGVHA